MKWLWVLLVVFIVGLQYRLWVGENSLAELWGVKAKIEAQDAINTDLQARNDALKAEVADLKQGLEAIEERARSELGMIKDNETFYQLVTPATPQKSTAVQDQSQ
ncbi:MAG: cell division protein FtsB [Pseudomonadales bacterium]